MQPFTETQISKWWLRGIAFLLATSPPAFLLWIEDFIAPHLASLSPVVVVRIMAGLLLTASVLFAYILLQRPWLRWDEPTGTWVSRFDGMRYCGTCRAKKSVVPLKNEITGWRCVACNTFRTDPARKPKKQPNVQPDDLSTHSWMGR